MTDYYCKKNQVQVLLSEKNWALDKTNDWIVIGYPGVDGMSFNIRTKSDDKSVYLHYPIDDEFVKIATSISDLIKKWKENKLIF